eukprot:CAMPEP_0172300654 /NCGR_PEP_ID=MMETSP1058-20130122/2676_1 /TAXON_ID=83371 /ORGANISM="Detonula confervacea, Strain CCMP 353" /LENGTH=986 /DNA_ID=CAMNT_0013010479 /DNA_START=25 /DNA_END=2988 /DNA_ORIENTATION=-
MMSAPPPPTTTSTGGMSDETVNGGMVDLLVWARRNNNNNDIRNVFSERDDTEANDDDDDDDDDETNEAYDDDDDNEEQRGDANMSETESSDDDDDTSSEDAERDIDDVSAVDDDDGVDESSDGDVGHRYRWKNDSNGRDDKQVNDQGKLWDMGEQERKKSKKDFLRFADILMECIIKGKDPNLHAKAQAIMEDCKSQHEQFQLGYENITTSIRVALKQLLHRHERDGNSSAMSYWKQAERELAKTLEEEEHHKEKENTKQERHVSWSCIDPGFSMGGLGRGWREQKDFSLLTQVLLRHMELQKQQGGHVLCPKVQDILEGFKATNGAPLYQHQAEEEFKKLLSESGHWHLIEQWYKDIVEALNRVKENASAIAKSDDQIQAFLQVLPLDPVMSSILLNRASKIILSNDPVVPVVARLVQSSANKRFLLHDAAKGGASLGVIKYLAEKYPEALESPDEKGCLPLHGFLRHHKAMKDPNGCQKVLAIAEYFADAAPASLSTPLPNGEVALHLCFDLVEHMNYSPSGNALASIFMERYPKALDMPGSFCDYTPLQHALYRKAPLDLLQRMVELAPESSRTTAKRNGELPMHTACQYGRIEVARMLLTKDALRYSDQTGWKPLAWSNQGEGGHNKKHLKAFINDVQELLGPKDFRKWLYVQVRYSKAATKALLSHSPMDAKSWVLNYRDKTGFLLLELELGKCEAAVSIGLLNVLIQNAPECLESTGPSFGQTPLHTAVTHDNLQAVDAIIKATRSNSNESLSQQDKFGRLPLHVAVMAGASLGILKLLINSYPTALWTPDNIGYTPLHHAFHVDPEKVGWWSPSCSCKKARLHHAGIKYLLGVVKFLIRHHGEDTQRALWIGDSCGRLPLYHALAEDGRVVEVLLREMGPACRSNMDSAGRTMCHVALQCHASYKTMEVLLDHNDSEQLDQPDGRGRLPLLVACESDCSIDVVYLLIRRAPHTVQGNLLLGRSPKTNIKHGSAGGLLSS